MISLDKIVSDLADANGLIASSTAMLVSLRGKRGSGGTVFNNEAHDAVSSLNNISENIQRVLGLIESVRYRDEEITQEIAEAAARAEEFERAKKDAKTAS